MTRLIIRKKLNRGKNDPKQLLAPIDCHCQSKTILQYVPQTKQTQLLEQFPIENIVMKPLSPNVKHTVFGQADADNARKRHTRAKAILSLEVAAWPFILFLHPPFKR